METRKVISRVRKFEDYYGFDVMNTEELKTKKDCLEALEAHKRWLEDALVDALRGVDNFMTELGLDDIWVEQS